MIADGETLCGTLTADKSFVTNGLWAIDSLNPNSWTGAEDYLARTGADVVLVQETKRLAGPTEIAAERAAARMAWSASLEPSKCTDAGGISAGVAVCVRSHIGLALPRIAVAAKELSARVQVRWMGAMCRGGVHLISAYLWTAEGLSKRNLDLLQALAEVVQAVDGPWILAADFNLRPELLEKSGWLKMVRGTAFCTEAPTCGEQIYDYFVVSEGLAPAVRGVHLVADGGFAPHRPVRLYLAAGPRRFY